MASSCVVMKFGGTSVGDSKAIARVAEIVRGRLPQHPVVVVSAMARVTDQLLQMARAAGAGDRTTALTLARESANGITTPPANCSEPRCSPSSIAILAKSLKIWKSCSAGSPQWAKLTPRTTDHVASFGEVLSSKLVTAALSAHDIPAFLVDSRECVVTDETFTRAAPLFDETNAMLQEVVAPIVESERVPVMGGFIGATRAGVTTTIGRGGGDFSAAIVGAGLTAERIEIWTDVDGMMTTDPNLCSDARRIKIISFDEAAELAYFGAKVLHPATVLPAIQKNIPVYILNSRNPSCEGTRIAARAPHCKNFFKAIAAKKRITIVDVAAPRMLLAHGFLKAIFDAFDRHRIPVDVVSTSEVSVSLTVDSNESIPALAADLAKLADVKYEGRKAIVCLVGENLREIPGIAAHVFGELSDVKIRMISQGASEINLTFVIDEEQVPSVVQRLHKRFFAELDPEIFA